MLKSEGCSPGGKSVSQHYYQALAFPTENRSPHPADLNANVSISQNEFSAYYGAFKFYLT